MDNDVHVHDYEKMPSLSSLSISEANLVAKLGLLLRLVASKVIRRIGLSPNLLSSAALDLKSILERNYATGAAFSFILVGAHDGVSHDFLFDFIIHRNSSGICIEPQPDVYKHLLNNSSYNSRIISVNKAVHPTLKEVSIFRVRPQKLIALPDWASGIASLDSHHHERSDIPSKFMEAIQVPSDHLMNILESYNFTGAKDLLQIDTEGFDLEVLRMVDFTKLQPSIIKLEHVNLAKDDIRTAINILRKFGYCCLFDQNDLLGINRKQIRI